MKSLLIGNEQVHVGLQLLNNEGCICPSESLTYKCTTFGEREWSTCRVAGKCFQLY